MENPIPYCYKADDFESYNSLAAHIVTSSLNASFYPKLNIVVVSPQEEDAPEALDEIKSFIEKENLDVQSNPIILHNECRNDLIESEIAPSCILREIIYRLSAENRCLSDVERSYQTRLEACEKNLKEARERQDRYEKWVNEERFKCSKYENTIIAVKTLLNVVID